MILRQKSIQAMKLNEIVDIETTRGISTKDLRKMTQQMQDAANKRVKRLMEDPIGSQSIIASRARERIAQGQSGYFSMTNVKNRDQLVARFKQLRSFLNNSKTGSLKAFRKTYKQITERLGGAPSADFWKAYRELARMYPDGNFPGGYDSTEVQRLMMRYTEDAETAEELVQRTLAALEEQYLVGEEEEYEEFFDLVDNEEDLPF